ncbi:MAG: hypothetical protein KGI80_00645 [Verrucomicrobiota bacterium]|nr:hypothetical protein [Verrucomicrobiota bacterium]
MDKNRFVNKMKDGLSIHDIENFTSKNATQVLTVIALVVAGISSIFNFFTGPKLSVFFLVVGTLLAIFFPLASEKGLKQFYTFTFKQEKVTELIFGSMKILVALFIPFLYFGFIGLLAGTSYHYFVRHGQILKANEPKGSGKAASDDEHD